MSRDFRDLLSAFTAQGVEFLVVGAHALAAQGIVRATGDLDVWIRPSEANVERVMSALREFGAPLHDLSSSDLAREDVVLQIGVAPVRIDVRTSITGVEFRRCLEREARDALRGASGSGSLATAHHPEQAGDGPAPGSRRRRSPRA